MADDQDNGQGGDNQPEETIEELRARLKEREASIAKLEEASRKASGEAKRLREEKQAAAEAERKRRLADQPEADRYEHEKREWETERQRLEREKQEVIAARIRDKQDIEIRDAIARMPATGPQIDVEFADVVCALKIDREMLEVNDQGKIVGGLQAALAKVARENPKYLVQKPAQRGSGPINRNDGQGRQPASKESNNPFFERTSYNT